MDLAAEGWQNLDKPFKYLLTFTANRTETSNIKYFLAKACLKASKRCIPIQIYQFIVLRFIAQLAILGQYKNVSALKVFENGIQ